jgi:uncharacterized protein HemX
LPSGIAGHALYRFHSFMVGPSTFAVGGCHRNMSPRRWARTAADTPETDRKTEQMHIFYRVDPAATTDRSRTWQGRGARSIAGAVALALALMVGTSVFAQSTTPAPQNDATKPTQSATTAPTTQATTADSNQPDMTKKAKLHCNDPDNPACL